MPQRGRQAVRGEVPHEKERVRILYPRCSGGDASGGKGASRDGPGSVWNGGILRQASFRRDLSFSGAKARRGQAEKGLRCLAEKGWPRAPSFSNPVVVAFTAAAFLQQPAASPFRLATPSSLEWWPILATTLSAAIRCGESTPPLKSQRGATTTTNRRRSHDQTNA